MSVWKNFGEWARAVMAAEDGAPPDPRLEGVENVKLIGGPHDGLTFRHATVGAKRLALPGSQTSKVQDNGDGTATPVFAVTYYADTGRRTADPRRVFAPEGGT